MRVIVLHACQVSDAGHNNISQGRKLRVSALSVCGDGLPQENICHNSLVASESSLDFVAHISGSYSPLSLLGAIMALGGNELDIPG